MSQRMIKWSVQAFQWSALSNLVVLRYIRQKGLLAMVCSITNSSLNDLVKLLSEGTDMCWRGRIFSGSVIPSRFALNHRALALSHLYSFGVRYLRIHVNGEGAEQVQEEERQAEAARLIEEEERQRILQEEECDAEERRLAEEREENERRLERERHDLELRQEEERKRIEERRRRLAEERERSRDVSRREEIGESSRHGRDASQGQQRNPGDVHRLEESPRRRNADAAATPKRRHSPSGDRHGASRSSHRSPFRRDDRDSSNSGSRKDSKRYRK